MKKLITIILITVLITGCGGKEVLDGSVNIDTSIEKREGTVGKSDKDFTEVTTLKPSTVRNDTTEKWRKVTISKSGDINEYLLSYNKLYMAEDTTVHAIVNFTNKTTTLINDNGDYINVRTHEYRDKEEHDAKKLGSGMLLGEFNIYKDNGDIIKVE